MESKKVKWLIYTVLVGLIPIFARLFAWGVTKENSVSLLSASDFVAFGLVLHISNINELEHFSGLDDKWKTIYNGVSIVFIAFYSVLLALNLLGDNIVDSQAMIKWTVLLSIVSFFISYSIYFNISRIPSSYDKDLE